jgi:ribosomal protein S18 acetylase RimI-like enzyme
MRPGRPADLPAVVTLWRADVRGGRRDSMPRQSHLEALAARFDWEARSRVVEDRSGGLAGAAMVAAYPSPDGSLAQLDVSATNDATIQDLTGWGLGLARASGAITTMVWVGRGHGEPLRQLGLQLARPWWRMDRSLATQLPEPKSVPGYELVDGRTVAPGSWADTHNRSFADHWRFSYRAEDELVGGKAPELCLMVVTAGRDPAALTLCELENLDVDPRPQPVGIVRSVGTVPAHRRRGLASWLVAEGLIRLRDAGARHASLYVDAMNQTRAYEAYRKLGFEVAFEAEVWEATSK